MKGRKARILLFTIQMIATLPMILSGMLLLGFATANGVGIRGQHFWFFLVSTLFYPVLYLTIMVTAWNNMREDREGRALLLSVIPIVYFFGWLFYWSHLVSR